MRGLAIATLLGLLVGAALDLWVGWRPSLSGPSKDDLQAALVQVQAERGPRDVLVHSPLFEPALLSVLDDVGASPTPRHGGRQWVLDHARQPMLVPGRVEARQRFGDVELRLMVSAPRTDGPAYDLRRDLGPDTLRVEDRRGEIVSRCRVPRSPDGFSCPGQPEWVYAAPIELMIDGTSRPCVWAHPKADLTLVFELPAPPEPSRLRIGAGLSDGATQMANGAPVEIELRQKRTLKKLRVLNRKGWNERVVPVRPGPPVEIRIQTRHDGMRHLCIDVRSEPPVDTKAIVP